MSVMGEGASYCLGTLANFLGGGYFVIEGAITTICLTKKSSIFFFRIIDRLNERTNVKFLVTIYIYIHIQFVKFIFKIHFYDRII